jgi:hypothetical protein
MPGLRGKPAGVGPSLGTNDDPPVPLGSPPPSFDDTLPTAATSADGPTSRIAAPPTATSGRHHSTATGGAPAPSRPPRQAIGRLFLRAAADDGERWRSPAKPTRGSRTCAGSPRAGRPPARERRRDRDARRAAARAHVHHGPGSARRTGQAAGSRRDERAAPRPDPGSPSARASPETLEPALDPSVDRDRPRLPSVSARLRRRRTGRAHRPRCACFTPARPAAADGRSGARSTTSARARPARRRRRALGAAHARAPPASPGGARGSRGVDDHVLAVVAVRR